MSAYTWKHPWWTEARKTSRIKVSHGVGRDKTRKRVMMLGRPTCRDRDTYVRRADIPRGRIPSVVAGVSIDVVLYTERIDSADK